MRVLICGSRTWTDRDAIAEVIANLPNDTVIIHGAAAGADRLAGEVALFYRLIVNEYPADWQKNGRRAGPIRNQQMLDEGSPDEVIAFRKRGSSIGTDDMIRRARAAALPVRIVEGESDGQG